MTDYDIKESITRKIRIGLFNYTARICPECFSHKQSKIGKFVDCKNEFFKITNGKKQMLGQCFCYSKEHGVKS